MKKYKNYLIYDINCPFCVNVAFSLKHLIQVDNLVLVPNNHTKRILKLSKKLKPSAVHKDVHLVEDCKNGPCIFSGADAVARVLSMKKETLFLWTIHKSFPFVFKLIYYVSKKIRIFIMRYHE
jgi:predicted DCC family thiol-disulfide oxidoreductase YuxK